jgi:hypothetical protein
MAIRRFRDHFAQQNWFAVVLDVLIVVLGVFLGIQVNNWNEGRLERQQGRDYRAMLVDDLNTNLSDLAMRRHYYEWVRAEALATLADLDRPSRDLDESFLLEAYQASQMQPWSLKRDTYDQILAVGAMSRLGSPLLRDRIANYYVGADVTGTNMIALPPYREILRRVMPYPVQQSIRARCNERIEVDERGATHIITPSACELGLDPGGVRQAVAQVHDWPGLSLDLNRWLVDLDQKLVSVNTISRRAQQLKTRLDQAGN